MLSVQRGERAVRVVLDTNTVVSALLWGGNPGRLLDLIREGRLHVFTTIGLLAELDDVLRRPKLDRSLQRKGGSADALMAHWRALAEVVDAGPKVAVVQADPDDDEPVACAVAAKADLLISGDKHLLSLRAVGGTRIVAAAEAVRLCDTPPG